NASDFEIQFETDKSSITVDTSNKIDIELPIVSTGPVLRPVSADVKVTTENIAGKVAIENLKAEISQGYSNGVVKFSLPASLSITANPALLKVKLAKVRHAELGKRVEHVVS